MFDVHNHGLNPAQERVLRDYKGHFGTVEELWTRFPSGGEFGWYAVTGYSSPVVYCWSVAYNEWRAARGEAALIMYVYENVAVMEKTVTPVDFEGKPLRSGMIVALKNGELYVWNGGAWLGVGSTGMLELFAVVKAGADGRPDVESPFPSRIYLVPNSKEGDNVYNEWIYTPKGNWEALGHVTINDLRVLADEPVLSNEIANGAVIEEKLGASAVIEAKLANNAVTKYKISEGAVSSSRLAENAVTEGKILNGAVIADKLAANSVTGVKISNGAVTAAKLQGSAVTTDKLNDGAVTGVKIALNEIQTDHIVDRAITTKKLARYSVNTENINGGAITTEVIAHDAIYTENILNYAVIAEKIDNGAVNTAKLANNSVSTAKIQNNAVTADKIPGELRIINIDESSGYSVGDNFRLDPGIYRKNSNTYFTYLIVSSNISETEVRQITQMRIGYGKIEFRAGTQDISNPSSLPEPNWQPWQDLSGPLQW
ncbi:MAG: hypothetical protein LBL04_02415 [Bacteroidales bacterium]|jgi:hypothetical protein|nr:hypothetical protein [Bacteroidales bacterium]